MRQNEILDALQTRPFRPLRIHVSDGSVYEVRHPELAHLTRSSVLICTQLEGYPPPFIERFHLIDLLHVTQVEYIDSSASTAND